MESSIFCFVEPGKPGGNYDEDDEVGEERGLI
jgi:hypothetical protein